MLEVSHQHPQLRPGARTGVWCATKLATDAGGWRQINRAGHPMMWPIFWPNDTGFTNPANTRHPAEDVDAAAKYTGEQIAAVVGAAGTSDDPSGYGQAVAGDLFPDLLPYVVGTPAAYGFAGFNGRTMADNAPEVMLSLAVVDLVEAVSQREQGLVEPAEADLLLEFRAGHAQHQRARRGGRVRQDVDQRRLAHAGIPRQEQRARR